MTAASVQIVLQSRRRIARTSRQMRTSDPQMPMALIPAPGTTEALELGCTCQFIAHDTAIREREPAGNFDRTRSELSVAWHEPGRRLDEGGVGRGAVGPDHARCSGWRQAWRRNCL